jgi:hypothetical protein
MGNDGTGDGEAVVVARGVGGAGWMAPVAINDARPTTSTTAPSDSRDLYRAMPHLIIDARPYEGDAVSWRTGDGDIVALIYAVRGRRGQRI